MTNLADQLDWFQDAACRGMVTEEFYPNKGAHQITKSLPCKDCPVREQCLDYGIQFSLGHGVWGGKSERSRRRIRIARRNAQL